MSHWLIQKTFNILIKILLKVKPVLLFHKVNRLDWYQNTLRQWVNTQKFNGKVEILEVGCATGSLSTYLSECGYITTAADVSEAMIATAKLNNPNANYYVANVTNLPFEDGKFDAVISASLINIVSDKQTALEEMKRVCKKGGFINIFVPIVGFSDQELQNLVENLRISGFSEAALRAWHKFAPKMEIPIIKQLYQKVGLTNTSTTRYLQGMVMSFTATKE